MANQTAAREFRHLNSTAQIPVTTIATQTSWWRGAAVGVLIDGASNIGRATKTLDGTVMCNFAGVMERNLVTSALGTELPLKRDGAVSFTANGTPDATWLGKPMWFIDDQTVDITPPSQLYPVYAGRCIAINGMLGYAGLSSTQVMVEISEAVQRPSVQWSILPFVVDLAILNANNLDMVAAFTFARRVFIGRIFATCAIAVATGTITWLTKVNASNAGGAASAITGTLGATDTRSAYTLVDYNDTITVNFASDGNTTAGLFQIGIEYLPLQ